VFDFDIFIATLDQTNEKQQFQVRPGNRAKKYFFLNYLFIHFFFFLFQVLSHKKFLDSRHRSGRGKTASPPPLVSLSILVSRFESKSKGSTVTRFFLFRSGLLVMANRRWHFSVQMSCATVYLIQDV